MILTLRGYTIHGYGAAPRSYSVFALQVKRFSEKMYFVSVLCSSITVVREAEYTDKRSLFKKSD